MFSKSQPIAVPLKKNQMSASFAMSESSLSGKSNSFKSGRSQSTNTSSSPSGSYVLRNSFKKNIGSCHNF